MLVNKSSKKLHEDIKIKIMFVSFLTMFFVIHPVNFLCSENCLISALLFSAIFSFLNINIYRYVKGADYCKNLKIVFSVFFGIWLI
jgi:hypothetical protein